MIPVIECKTQEQFNIVSDEIRKSNNQWSNENFRNYNELSFVEINGNWSSYGTIESWYKEIEAKTHKLYTFEEWYKEFKTELITETNQVDDYSYLIKLLNSIDDDV
jgi:hypothetical protein